MIYFSRCRKGICAFIFQTHEATNDNKMYEVRRFVAIVPYQNRIQNGIDVLISSLVNAAVVLFWLFGAAIFTMLRVGLGCVDLPYDNGRLLGGGPITKTTIYFNYLAGVLGNSAGIDRQARKCDSLLWFVIGVFATLSSMLFTSALFELLISHEPIQQIDTIEDLIASNLTIMMCAGDPYIRRGYFFIFRYCMFNYCYCH